MLTFPLTDEERLCNVPRVVRPGMEPRQLAFRGHAVSHTGQDFAGGEHVPSPGGAQGGWEGQWHDQQDRAWL